MTMSVSATTYAVESITFGDTNGASLVVTFLHHPGLTKYHLARAATVAAHFPQYTGNATITYGTYQINQPIAAAVFQQH
jgi:hypothetical protein